MFNTAVRARARRPALVIHRGTLGDLAAFTGRVLMRCAMIVIPFLIAVVAYQNAETGFQTVVIALMILVYCAVRFVGITVVERGELAMISAQQVATDLARRTSRFDLDQFVTALRQMRADHEKSHLQATVECGSLAILSYYAVWAIVGPL